MHGRDRLSLDADSQPTFEVGSDVGGTFTDVWVRASDGRAKVSKSPTTPDIVSGVITALGMAADAFATELGVFCQHITRFGHGTTVALNALLTGRTGKTAVITTKGFADTLEIGRMKRQFTGLNETEVSDYLKRNQYPPIVSRHLVAEVTERIDPTGTVLTELDEAETADVLRRLIDETEVEAIAICTLWAVENASHEQRIREVLVKLAPSVAVSVSHEVAPSVGEYARMSTTAANAALKPITSSYTTRLQESLAELGLGAPVLMTTGTGGVVPAAYLADLPVAALLSGPAAGVMACHALGRRMGRDRLLTTDIGGTSFDVGLVVDDVPLMASAFAFGGVDVRMPCVDVRSIGAGGGSIASVTFGGLTVGPQSAGANPGPACYGRGGTRPTATDADLVLGVLAPDDFVAGGLTLDREAAERAIYNEVAKPLALGLHEAAWGIRQVLDSRMADLLRQVTVERGHDPRTFTMFASGGSGPSHGWVLSRELGIAEFVVPATATVQSAFGSGTGDVKFTRERPLYARISSSGVPTAADLAEITAALEAVEGEALNAPLGDIDSTASVVWTTLALRYRGQSHHLDTTVQRGDLTESGFADIIRRFEQEYEQLFGKGAGFRMAGFDVLSVRTVLTRSLRGAIREASGQPLRALGSRAVWFDDPRASVSADLFAVEHPAAGQEVQGPCLVAFPGQTLVVPPGSTAIADELGNMIVSTT